MSTYKHLRAIQQKQHNPAPRKGREQEARETVQGCVYVLIGVNFCPTKNIAYLQFVSDLILYRGERGRTQIYSLRFMATLARGFVCKFV